MAEPQPLLLVVDDDPEIRSILSVKLEKSGMRVILSENGQDAIDKARQERPNLIVMDVRMPVMSGTEAVSIIKSDPQLKGIKVVFLSNFGEEEEINSWLDQKYARDLGAMDYMKKTDDLDAIVKKIKELLSK
jgi:CheY-like chemotaxis protein